MKINLGSVYGLIFALSKISGRNDLSWWFILIGFIIGNLIDDDCDCKNKEDK